MINIIGGISFGILAIFYSIYLLKEYYLDFNKDSPKDFVHLPKGLLGLALLYIISIYCLVQYFQ